MNKIVDELNELIPQGALYREVGYRFFREYLVELKKNLSKKKMPSPSGNAFQKVVRRWMKNHDEPTVSEASRIARKLIEHLRTNIENFSIVVK